MRTRSKRYGENVALLESGRLYEPLEAVQLLKQMRPARCDETVEISIKLHIDTRKSDQLVRGSVNLPRGTGKNVRIIVFATGQDELDAREAGVADAGGDELIEKITKGWMDFDVAIAHPQMMSKVGRLGKVLGPRGLMPSPKSGTVTPNVKRAVEEFKAGKIEFRSDSGGNVHAPAGKVSFEPEALEENVRAFIDHIRSIRPVAVKGTYIEGIALASTFGPGIPLKV